MTKIIQRPKEGLIYGFLIWLLPFIASFPIFPLRETNRPLFESIMPVVLTLVVMTLTVLYFKDIRSSSIREGILIGVLWFLISIAIDLLMFLPPSPMQMTFIEYMMDIGLTYLVILMLPIFSGYYVKLIINSDKTVNLADEES